MATKCLARRLGLVRSSARARSSAQAAAGQCFGYLIVVDFEATCWRNRERRGPEIIEFPAVLLNCATGELESEFHTYVQPQEHPILSDFCTDLTGIKQSQVDEGVPLNICLSQFLKWIQSVQKEKKIIFPTDRVRNSTSEAKACTFVTWTDWDLGVCLHYECKRKQLRKPDILNSWIDLKATYRAFYNRKPQGLSSALQDLGITFAGREHSGLDDSRNTARLAWRMICDGCVLKVTKSLDKALSKKNSISRTLTINSTDKTPLGCKSRPETFRDGPSEASSVPEKNQSGIAGVKRYSQGQTEQQTTCTNCSPGGHDDPSSSSRTELCAQSQRSSAASTDTFPVPHEPAQQPPSTGSHGVWQGLNNGHPLSTAQHSPAVHGPGLVLVSTTIPSVHVSSEDVSTSSECLPLLADWEDVALIAESQHEQNSDNVQLHDDSRAGILTASEEHTSQQLALLGSANPSLEKATAIPLQSTVYRSPDTTIYSAGRAQRQTSNCPAFKLPSAKVTAMSAQSAKHPTPSEVPKRKATSPKMLPPAKRSFAIYEEKRAPFDCSLPLRSSNWPRVSPAILNATVNAYRPVRAVRNRNQTPPLCQCGRRAKKLCVSNGGPNHGKVFFCCPAGKQEGPEKGCGYFRWEDGFLKEQANSLTLQADAVPSLGTGTGNSGTLSNKKYLCLRPSLRT